MNSLQDPFKQKRVESRNPLLYKLVVGVVAIVLVAAGTYFLVLKPQQESAQAAADQAKQAQETEKYNNLVAKIKKTILVPDESPTIATIANLTEVQKQNATFYADAKEGDTVIIFSTKALIYRESEDKIINVAPVTKEDSTTTTP